MFLSGQVGVVAGAGTDLPGVDVHAELALLGEGEAEGHHVPFHPMTHVLIESLLLVAIAVEGCHEVR